ncbi:MAG: hypothetical protein HUJ42_01005 [Malacoplasma sp.]|nr:hypothetical protein [Malacoplasma sp.]
MNDFFSFVLQAANGGDTSAGDYQPGNVTSWLYYLFGAIFVVLAIVCLVFAWLYRNTRKEYENLAFSFGQFKRFWYKYRFALMILFAVACIAIAIAFFTTNAQITKNLADAAKTS